MQLPRDLSVVQGKPGGQWLELLTGSAPQHRGHDGYLTLDPTLFLLVAVSPCSYVLATNGQTGLRLNFSDRERACGRTTYHPGV